MIVIQNLYLNASEVVIASTVKYISHTVKRVTNGTSIQKQHYLSFLLISISSEVIVIFTVFNILHTKRSK